jgi:hypothetical protein
MFDFFKQRKENKPADVKSIRDVLLQFIKEELRKVEGGEGSAIRGLHLFLNPAEGEKHLYESAVYIEEENRFRNEEVQRIADDYAIDLPQAWTLDISFGDEVPQDAIRAKDINAALYILSRKQPSITKTATAYIHVLNGVAEQPAYTITSEGGKTTIGRDKKVQTGDGFFRINTIAFDALSNEQANQSISRQHAHIEWSSESGGFLLFADDGGVPPRNKVKVRSGGAEAVKLQTTAIGHLLKEGDQIILGESALLQFSYSNTVI